jgi:hypothetical protein
MSVRFVDDKGKTLCSKGPRENGKFSFENGKPSSFRCPCPRAQDIQIHCEDSWGDGWHGGFIEVSTDGGSSTLQFCTDFMTGKVQVETLPSSCALSEVDAEEVSLEELAEVMHDEDAQAQEVDTAKWAAKSYGTIALGFLGSLASCGVAMGGNVVKAAHPLRHVLLGLDSMANDPFDASEQRQAAQEVIQFTMKDTYEDLNNVSAAVLGCIGTMAENFREEMQDTEERLLVRMRSQDFKKLLTKLFLNTQHRLGRVLDYLTAPGNITWLVASVEEGLHTCIDVGVLADQVSTSTIVEVMNSLTVVNRWFTMCVAFIILSKHLQRFEVGGAAFNAQYRTEVFLGRNFMIFYQATKRIGEATLSKVSTAVRPFELRVLNYLNLVSTKHYHAINNLTFPHRQGGVAEPPVITQGFGGATSYTRVYSVGTPRQFAKTCRFCRRDGGKKVHYGCWEEEALSFERCVSADGIFYNTSLSVSNEYSCKQFQQMGSVSCGGRPLQ